MSCKCSVCDGADKAPDPPTEARINLIGVAKKDLNDVWNHNLKVLRAKAKQDAAKAAASPISAGQGLATATEAAGS